ncbi:MAG TPA: histidine kinase [Acidimicrobiia bacterium]|nr:histidine kinase [Acidimicrobiia bacterium]
MIAPKGIPMWVYCGAGAFAASLSGVALAQGGSSFPAVVQIPLAVALMIPWIPGVKQQWVSWTFVALSLVPMLALEASGASPLLFGLLALSASRVAVSTTWPRSVLYGLAAIGIVFARIAFGHSTNWPVWKTYVELGLALGWAMRTQRLLIWRTREAGVEHARVAALDERRRIARDVHDVLAHTLTILMVHLNSARLQVLEDPEGTAEVLDEVARYGRSCLEEIRRTVGLLSEPSVEQAAGPIEAANAIESLVASYRNAGLDVDLRLDVEMAHMGKLASADPAIWAAGYRIVQESLANSTKHAHGARAEVWIGVDDAGLHLRCTNAFVPGVVALEIPNGGNGIIGMRERAVALGGELDAGLVGQQWIVRADLPLNILEAEASTQTSLGRAS